MVVDGIKTDGQYKYEKTDFVLRKQIVFARLLGVGFFILIHMTLVHTPVQKVFLSKKKDLVVFRMFYHLKPYGSSKTTPRGDIASGISEKRKQQ